MTEHLPNQLVSATRTIPAPAHAIFEVIADASRHPDFDGSGTVRSGPKRSEPLTLGSRFSTQMRLGPLPYVMSNVVVEFEPDRLIAWRHLGGHRWRYELQPIDADSTQVTESFDWSTAPAPTRMLIENVGYPTRNQRSIESTLDRLSDLFDR